MDLFIPRLSRPIQAGPLLGQLTFAAAVALACTSTAIAGPIPPRYTITRIAMPSGIEHVHAMDINDRGEVIATVEMASDSPDSSSAAFATTATWGPGGATHAYLFTQESADHPFLVGRFDSTSTFVGINNQSEYFVSTQNLLGTYAQLRPSAESVFEGLRDDFFGPVDVGTWTRSFTALDIDDTGNMVGYVETGEWVDSTFMPLSMWRPVLRMVDGRLVTLTAPSHYRAIAHRMNNNGDVIGLVGTDEAWGEWSVDTQPAIWPLGESLDFDAPYELFDDPYRYTTGINDPGQIVARRRNSTDGTEELVVLDPDGTVHVLDVPGEFIHGSAISDAGVVIGAAELDPLSEVWLAIVAHPQAGTYLFNDLLSSSDRFVGSTFLFAINDAGQIVGSGEIDGELSLFIATPVPEPIAVIYLLLAGPWLLRRA